MVLAAVALAFYEIIFSQQTCAQDAKGTGEAPKAQSSPQAVAMAVPKTLDFSSQQIDTTSDPKIVTITAPSDAELKVTNFNADGDFAATSKDCITTLQKSATCTISVVFTPKRAGAASSELKITTDPPTLQNIRLTGTGTCNSKFGDAGCYASAGVAPLVLGLLYFVGMVLVRWNMIARPSRTYCGMAIVAVRARIENLEVTTTPAPVGTDKVKALLTKAEDLVGVAGWPHFADIVFWSRGQEIAAWGYVHEAEEQMVAFLPADGVRAALERAEDDLHVLGTPNALALAERIATNIQQANIAAVPDTDRRKALLYEALGLLYDRTDTDFSNLISWQNKTGWLVFLGLGLVVALSIVIQNPVLFLLGATGGLLSRLSRSLQRADVPTDYGASWTTLFLSPVVGALAGWSGILLVIIGGKLNILSSAIAVSWSDPTNSTMTLGLAFIFGFSERLFDGILSQLEQKIGNKNELAKSSSSSLIISTGGKLPDAKINVRYDQKLIASGATPPYTWSLVSGTLPVGLNLDSGGAISGTPKDTPGTSKFTLQVNDAKSVTKSQEFEIAVSP